MPTYEYACPACDATHEVQQKMSDPTLTACPVCGQPGVRKLFTGVGIHFKGSGFYRTDSRDAKSSAGSTGTSTPSSSGDSGSSTGSSTPAAGSGAASTSSSTGSSTPSTPSKTSSSSGSGSSASSS